MADCFDDHHPGPTGIGAEGSLEPLMGHCDSACLRKFDDAGVTCMADTCVDGGCRSFFCDFSRQHYAQPVPYPTACSPQAWAATAPIALITSLMRYDAHVSRGGLWLNPVLPESFGDLHISNAPMGRGRITVDVTGSTASVRGLPEDMTFHRGHRPWMTELVDQARRHPEPRPDG